MHSRFVLPILFDSLTDRVRQLVDDMLDFTASSADLGKPGQGADLKLGLATAPALYAWEEFPELGAMIERKFCEEDDVERVSSAFLASEGRANFEVRQARYLISQSSGAERTATLAASHATAAKDCLKGLPESEARTALEELTDQVLARTK